MTGQQAASVAVLRALVDRVAPRDAGAWEARPRLRRGQLVSKSRAYQLRATVAQLERALALAGDGGRVELPDGAADEVGVLLSPESVDAVIEAARDGLLRDPRQKPLRGKPLPDASLGTLRDCLAILGEEAGVEVVLPQVWRPQGKHLAKPATRRQTAALYRRLADMAAGEPLDPLLARTLAAVGVILDTGMRRGDMVSRRVEDVDLGAGTIRAVHHRQNAAHLPPRVETVVLREGTVVALRRWLEHRAVLVAGLDGGDPGALWVTLVPHGRHRPGEPGVWETYAAGLPLRVNGFALAHAVGVDRLNTLLAGRWEGPGRWRPLPRRPEQLRRAVEWEHAG